MPYKAPPKKLIRKPNQEFHYLHQNQSYFDLKKLLEHIDRKFTLNLFDQPLKDCKKESVLLQFIEKVAMYIS